eukprot:CAMPEP_0170497876 /NCGR_PEP_ID=MMETSP0208-20121228/26113_1 /TAXON_ID=197538 /ORGANISM="Strombidium inclinatum, Strain S3" /LENGTH=88 /DNA_ID=CAMNT_0010774839 /DNA_START=511 /DNA_END=776 /DNA_ORIENTATION=+
MGLYSFGANVVPGGEDTVIKAYEEVAAAVHLLVELLHTPSASTRLQYSSPAVVVSVPARELERLLVVELVTEVDAGTREGVPSSDLLR